MAIKTGDAVRQILPAPITGVVTKKEFDEASDSFNYLVESTDSDGVQHTRWFSGTQIEGVPA